MKPKKTKKADLNNYSFTFMLIGLVVVMSIALKAINMKTYTAEVKPDNFFMGAEEIDDTEIIEIEKPKPEIKIEKPKALAKLKIEDNKNKVEEDLLNTSEDEPDEPIEDVADLDTEDVEPTPTIEVPWTKVERVPVFPGCEKYKNNNEQLKKCMNKKINRLVAKKFRRELAQDLGLYGGRVKIFSIFTIDENGNIVNIQTRSQYQELAKEAERVIKLFPKMEPGKQHNENVKVTYNLPIIFNVPEE